MIVWGGQTGSNDRSLNLYYPYSYFAVGGDVQGLLTGNVLSIALNMIEEVAINDNGEYYFQTVLPDGGEYEVTIVEQPNNPIQKCNVFNNMGSISSQNIFDVNIVCDESIDLIFRDNFD